MQTDSADYWFSNGSNTLSLGSYFSNILIVAILVSGIGSPKLLEICILTALLESIVVLSLK